MNNGCENDLLFDVGECEWRESGSCRIGLEGADGCGLCPPSLSLEALLGGVGGMIRLSTFTATETKIYIRTGVPQGQQVPKEYTGDKNNRC